MGERSKRQRAQISYNVRQELYTESDEGFLKMPIRRDKLGRQIKSKPLKPKPNRRAASFNVRSYKDMDGGSPDRSPLRRRKKSVPKSRLSSDPLLRASQGPLTPPRPPPSSTTPLYLPPLPPQPHYLPPPPPYYLPPPPTTSPRPRP